MGLLANVAQLKKCVELINVQIIEPNCVFAEILYFSCFIPNSQSLL